MHWKDKLVLSLPVKLTDLDNITIDSSLESTPDKIIEILPLETGLPFGSKLNV